LSSETEDVAITTEAAVSEKIVNLGRRLGMNTDLRRSVFYAIITSDVRSLLFFNILSSLILKLPSSSLAAAKSRLF